VDTQSDIRDKGYRTEPDIGNSDIRRRTAEFTSDISIYWITFSTDIQYLPSEFFNVYANVRILVDVHIMSKSIFMFMQHENEHEHVHI
jgi:hypothetical protein